MDFEPYHVPPVVMDEWIQQCKCCRECGQDIPCAGVMAGGPCDNFCECEDYFNDYEYEI